MKNKKIHIKIKIKNDPKQRVTWGFNPMTRIVPSKKIYSRKNYKISY